jgi:hypothetical protein
MFFCQKKAAVHRQATHLHVSSYLQFLKSANAKALINFDSSVELQYESAVVHFFDSGSSKSCSVMAKSLGRDNSTKAPDILNVIEHSPRHTESTAGLGTNGTHTEVQDFCSDGLQLISKIKVR